MMKEMEKQVIVPRKALYQGLIYSLVASLVPMLFIMAILIYFYLSDIVDSFVSFFAGEGFAFPYELTVIPLTLIVTVTFVSLPHLIRIMMTETNEYYFYSDEVVGKGRALGNMDETIPYDEIKSVDLIEDDIISKMLGMNIVGINAVEHNVLRGLRTGDRSVLKKDWSFGDVVSILGAGINSRGRSYSKRNPMIVPKRLFSEKHYQMFIPLPKDEARELKNFLDQKVEELSKAGVTV